ncbi:hypothetical protein [Streptomyces sp. NPDC085529]|uniref:hypothetical protein n=1 Tax=Streptomyces sp. NPDC085529 TaxID=3365729 RepID=UPI0037D1D9A8
MTPPPDVPPPPGAAPPDRPSAGEDGWDAAVVRLLGDPYTVVATGPGGTRTGQTTSSP